MISVDAGAGENMDTVDGGAGDNQCFMWKQDQEKRGILQMEEQKKTSYLYGLGAGKHQKFFRRMSKR